MQHTGGHIQQNEYAFAAHPDASDVAAITAGIPEAADLLSRRASIQAARLQSPLALFQSADIRLELLDALAPGDTGVLVSGQLLALVLQARGNAFGLCRIAGRLALGFLDLIA